MEGYEKATILIVDDTPMHASVMSIILTPKYAVKVAADGEQALKICFSDHPPDLILLDIMMPGMNGYDVCRQLKANVLSKDIPVIFVTSMNRNFDEVLGFEVGAIDFISEPIVPAIVHARVKSHLELRAANKKLHSAYRFIRDTFGRYTSEEVVDRLIDTPKGLELGGEKREVTVLMADLRGFTSVSERVSAEVVVDIINIYLAEMTPVIQKHMGTINEFIGDAILAIFGAPVQRDDDAMRAVRCAVEMQITMEKVNRLYKEAGYPQIKMGIGINTGAAIVGNIGCHKRSKYGVVGMLVNTAARIESYTVGGQVLIAESTRNACDKELRIDDEVKVIPKGVSKEMTIFDIGGVYDDEPLLLAEKNNEPMLALKTPLDVQISPIEGKFSREIFAGKVLSLNGSALKIEMDQDCSMLSSLKLVIGEGSKFYVKVLHSLSIDPIIVHVSITYMPGEVETFLAKTMKEEAAWRTSRISF